MMKQMTIVTDPKCVLYHVPGHPERPERILRSIEKLKQQSDLPLNWASPIPVEETSVLRAHTARHFDTVKHPQGAFDADTPAHPDIATFALQSVGGALSALERTQKGESAFSLMRPPGHHAERDRAMGFCYLNQVAIAALEARDRGFERVAVYDFDVHHGNGTEDILLGHSGCTFFSIHQYPCYPGTGKRSDGNCHNYPVPPSTPRMQYRSVLQQALEDLQRETPSLIIVSAGFDAYVGDPLSEEKLEKEDFFWLGKMLSQTGIPVMSCLEGGYSEELSELILSYLMGLNSKRA